MSSNPGVMEERGLLTVALIPTLFLDSGKTPYNWKSEERDKKN